MPAMPPALPGDQETSRLAAKYFRAERGRLLAPVPGKLMTNEEIGPEPVHPVFARPGGGSCLPIMRKVGRQASAMGIGSQKASTW